MKNKPEIYWPMLQTAEQVAKRYNIGREAMDEYGAASQQRPPPRWKGPVHRRNRPHHRDHGRGRQGHGPDHQRGDRERGRGIRAGTTYEGIKGLRSALPGGLVSAGNASQFRRRWRRAW